MENDELHVLIVEDNEADYELMLHALRRGGFSTNGLRAAAKEAVVEALRSFDADVVLVDHTLPGSSGLEILHLVQQERPLLPVLVVTGSIDEETAADYIKAGAADYVIKDRLHRLAPAVLRALTLKDALQELMDAEAAREASEARFRSLVEHSTDVITLLDADGRIVYSTQSLQPTLGYAAGEMTGRSVFDLLQPEQRGTAEALLGNVLRHPEQVVRADLRVRHKEGAWRDLEVVVANRLSDPSLRALVVNYRDVTERKRAEENLRAADERLRSAQKMEAVGRLAAGIAHDFNNLLTIILGSAELLEERQGKLNPANTQLLRNIQAAGQQAATLTQRLLAFARKQPLEPRAIDLNQLMGGLKALLRRTLGEDVDIKMVLRPDLPKANIDDHQFEAAVLNLAINARDAMPHGGHLTIETALATIDEAAATLGKIEHGRYLVLSVADNGEGMAPDVRARALEPFFTTKPTGKGTGLGLSMVYGFVTQSGGQLTIYSELGLGTTVRLYLPLAESDVPAAPAVITKLPGGSETILVVEDEPELRELVTGMLRPMGYRILEAGNGQEALAMLAREPVINLLFTDVVMPGGMHGRALAQEAKKQRPDMRVLYTSGYTQDTMVHQGKLDEGVELLNKPYRRRDLAMKVREILDRPAEA